jgi:hypothetical protein
MQKRGNEEINIFWFFYIDDFFRQLLQGEMAREDL